MSVYTIELDGKRYKIEGDRPPTEEEARQAIGEFSNFSTQSDQPQQNTPQIEKQGILGQLLNVPGATSREAIRANPALAAAGPLAGLLALKGEGGQQAQQRATQGALNPSQSQTFQDQAIQAGQNSFGGPSTSVGVNFAKGLIPSAVGFAADFATDPTAMLLQTLFSALPKKTLVNNINKVIDKNFNKAVKPIFPGKKTSNNIQQFKEQSRSAVDSILENKNNLVFKDELGNVKQGQLPSNLDEFNQAITQTKRPIFEKYDQIAKESGATGAKIKLQPIADDIVEAVSRADIEDLHPSVQNYALDLATKLEKRGSYSLTEAQDAITGLNQNLKAYFRSGNPQDIKKLAIDKTIVNQLNKQLSETIEKSIGNNKYAILRKQWGALNSIEDSVGKAAFSNLKKSEMTAMDSLYNSYSLGEALVGLKIKATAQIVGNSVYKRLLDPNTKIKNMFNAADKIINVNPKVELLRGILNKAKNSVGTLPTSSNALINQ